MKSIKQISILFYLLISVSFLNLNAGFFGDFFTDIETLFAQQQKAMHQMRETMQQRVETLHKNSPIQNKTSVTIDDNTQNQQVAISIAGLKVAEQNELEADLDNNRLTITIPAGTIIVDIQQIRADLSYVSVALHQAYSQKSQHNKQNLSQKKSNTQKNKEALSQNLQDQQSQNRQNEESYYSFQNQQSYSQSVEGAIDTNKLEKNLADYIEYDQANMTLTIRLPKINKKRKERTLVPVKIVNKSTESTDTNKAESITINQSQTPSTALTIEPIDGGLIDEK